MSLIKRMLKYDKAVYWAPLGKNQFGKAKFANPVEMSCRWTDKITIRRDSDGAERIFNAEVFLSDDTDLDGMLWHGKLVDCPVDSGNPSIPPVDARLIKFVSKVPKLKYTEFVRQVNL